MSNRQDRIKEIIELSKKYGFSEKTIVKLIDDKYNEPRLHDFVWMLRSGLPEDLINMVVDNDYEGENIQIIIKGYHSDEIDNKILYLMVRDNKIEMIKKIMEDTDEKRNAFLPLLLSNSLFRNNNVDNFMRDNKLIYIRHEFNWHTYASRLVLTGENGKLYFPMPAIPLIGGCWSNYVAQRMLMGQMHLRFIFSAVKSSLDFLNETNDLGCTIVACDNCFYAPYLYFYRNKAGKIDDGFDDDAEKVYMDYLVNEYPKAYEWLLNHKPDEHFYENFYIIHTPNIN